VALQNEGPCRRLFDPGPGWRLLARLDGLDASVPTGLSAVVGPWELAFWRLTRC